MGLAVGGDVGDLVVGPIEGDAEVGFRVEGDCVGVAVGLVEEREVGLVECVDDGRKVVGGALGKIVGGNFGAKVGNGLEVVGDLVDLVGTGTGATEGLRVGGLTGFEVGGGCPLPSALCSCLWG